MKAYIVRFNSQQRRPRELVGFFLADNLGELLRLIDECCDADDCEFMELGAGGVYWGGAVEFAVPHPDGATDTAPNLPGDATTTESWMTAFADENEGEWHQITPDDMEDDFEEDVELEEYSQASHSPMRGPMKTVKQREENDCGVACVAMLAGASYDDARAAIYTKGRSKLTKTKDLHQALVSLGRKPLSAKRQRFGSKTLRDLDTDALVFVKMDDGDESKHWLVWDAKARKIRDPYHTKHNYRLLGYLAVE